jgi:pyruvate,water dikinase
MIFLELGRRYHALGILADPRDIFYLEVEEALGFVDGVTVTTNLKDLVGFRRAEFEVYHKQPPPPHRFETRSIPSQNWAYVASDQALTEPEAIIGPQNQTQQPQLSHNCNLKSQISNPKSLRGLGCSPGLVKGPVRVVTNPKAATLRPGDILVAQRTDPGWILLFPAAAGLLVEHGSLLSHSAIVARELGLPAVVSLPGLTRWLQDGDWVEFDGSTGVVKKLQRLIGE